MTSDLLPAMLDAALDLAARKTETIIANATNAMTMQLGREIERLEDLHRINSHVTLEEIAAARGQESALRATIGAARLRTGGLRLIWRKAKEG